MPKPSGLVLPEDYAAKADCVVGMDCDVEIELKVPDEALKDNLKYWNLRDNNTPFEKLLLYIICDGYREEFDLIILDPYYKLIPAGGYDENSAGDVMKVVSLIAKFSAATGAAFKASLPAFFIQSPKP